MERRNYLLAKVAFISDMHSEELTELQDILMDDLSNRGTKYPMWLSRLEEVNAHSVDGSIELREVIEQMVQYGILDITE